MNYGKKKESPKDPNALKITNQFRANRGMVYELRGDGNKLIVRVFPRESEQDPSAWRVEARTSDAVDAVVVTDWGATRIDTLRQVGLTWSAMVPTHGLPSFDWATVTEALNAVRAL